MTEARTTPGTRARTDVRTRSPLFAAVIGLASVAVLLQGLWAGLFIREGQDYKDNWVEVHDWGARIAFALAIVGFVVAVLQLRHRKELVIGSGALVVLLLVESWFGGEIGDKPNYTVIHFPLALALMALCVWLPLRAARGARE